MALHADFLRVGTASPVVMPGDCRQNADEMIRLLRQAAESGVELLVFPELCLTGATCGDLFLQPGLWKAAEQALGKILAVQSPVTAVVGLPVYAGGQLYNAAAVVQKGTLLGVALKQRFDAKLGRVRQFAPGETAPDRVTLAGQTVPMGVGLVFQSPQGKLGIALGEDEINPAGARLWANPMAVPETAEAHFWRKSRLQSLSHDGNLSIAVACAGWGESSTDGAYAGYTGIYESGLLLAESPRFQAQSQLTIADVDMGLLVFRDQTCRYPHASGGPVICWSPERTQKPGIMRPIAQLPFVPENDKQLWDAADIQITALMRRMRQTRSQAIVLGVSGGLDSALALMVAALAAQRMGLPPAAVHALSLPGMGTSSRTQSTGMALIATLGVTFREISITPAVMQHFNDIGHDPADTSVVYENAQARMRTLIVMDYANKMNALALGTGDMSESALGWCTYNGDHMSMYNCNAGVPKTLVKALVGFLGQNAFEGTAIAAQQIVELPISPELLPVTEGELQQQTEEILGPYPLHDFFLHHTLENGASPKKLWEMSRQAFEGEYDDKILRDTLKTFVSRFFSQQFKRSCVPDGPQVLELSLSPRGGLAMPSDAAPNAWLREIEEL